MPAGLLPVIAAGMGTSEGTVGLFVSAYALGTVIVTIPAITLTRGMRRKPLLLGAILGLILANSVTALSSDVALSLVSRFVAGRVLGNHLGDAGRLRPEDQPALPGRPVAGDRLRRSARRLRPRHATGVLARNDLRLAVGLRRPERRGPDRRCLHRCDRARTPRGSPGRPGFPWRGCSGSPASP